MANEAASLLDQLMGAHRNAVPGDNVKPIKFTDPEVCKHFLCGFCPSDLFTNTRADIGKPPNATATSDLLSLCRSVLQDT